MLHAGGASILHAVVFFSNASLAFSFSVSRKDFRDERRTGKERLRVNGRR